MKITSQLESLFQEDERNLVWESPIVHMVQSRGLEPLIQWAPFHIGRDVSERTRVIRAKRYK